MKVELYQHRLHRKNRKTYEIIEQVDSWHWRTKYIGNKREVVRYVGDLMQDAVWMDEPVSRPKTFDELLNRILC